MPNFDPSETLATFEHIYTHDIADFNAEVAIEIDDTVHSRGDVWDFSLTCEDATVTVRPDAIPPFSVRVTRRMLDDLDNDARQAIMTHLALGDVLPVMPTNQDGPDKVSEVVNMYLNGTHPRAVLTAVFTWLVGRLSL